MTIDANFEPMPFNQALVTGAQCKMLKMPKVMGQAFTEMKEYIDKEEIAHFPAPFTMYKDVDWDKFVNMGMFKMLLSVFTKTYDFDMGFPLLAPVEAPEGMKVVSYDHKEVATCIHKGPYQKVGKTYKELYFWLKDQGKEALDVSFEMYLNDPKETKPEDLETRLYIPVKD